jgi:valyl-tRNA synthetase
MITPQWYVKCDDMAARSAQAVRDGDLTILPKEQEKTWFQWLDNIRDWCVSRQLWWGHQIPAWFATKKGEDDVTKHDMGYNDRWIVARNEEVSSYYLKVKSEPKPLILPWWYFVAGGAREGGNFSWMSTRRHPSRAR